MSGSIGGDRIAREEVKPTVEKYISRVLSRFPGFQKAMITGSYNAGTKKDHGDIDLVVYIDSFSSLKDLKKSFSEYLNGLDDDTTVPFRSGKRIGQKSQTFGSLVTCQFPIEGSSDRFVQVDNIIVASEEDMNFQYTFLNMDAAKQALLLGLARVIGGLKKDAFEKMGFHDLKELGQNEEYEFVLSSAGLSLRKVIVENEKEISHEELWRTNKWSYVENLLDDFDLSIPYINLLCQVHWKIRDKRARRRIVCVMKSMINIGVGEIGTPKGQAKEEAIRIAVESLLS